MPVSDQQAFTPEYNDPDIEWGLCSEFIIPEGCELTVIQGNPENRHVFIKIF